METQTELCQSEQWKEINLFSAEQLSFYQQDANQDVILYKAQEENDHQLFPHFGSLDLYLDVVSPPFQFCEEEISKLAMIQSITSEVISPKTVNTYTPSSSFKILRNYKRKFSQFNGEKIKVTHFDTSTLHDRRVCNDAIRQLARQEARDINLIQNLLEVADNVGRQQYNSAKKLLELCGELSSNKGNLIHRLVSFFSNALQEKIDKETGNNASLYLRNEEYFDLQEVTMSPSLSVITYYQKLPFSPLCQFTEMQVILENVLGAKRVHIIDLAIRNGMQYTILMQALSTQNGVCLEYLKITAIGSKSKAKIEKAGNQLMILACALNIPFCFDIVMVSDMADLKKELFDLNIDEVIVVYSPTILSSMINRPNVLEHVMGVIKAINPLVMVISEQEANHNSPVFVNRFTDALLFYGAFFDSMEDCMDRGDPHRMILEKQYFSPGIRNIVAAEGDEREYRHITIDIWREFFSKFGMVEVQISNLSLFQANLLAKEFSCGNSCTLDLNRKSLIIGWKDELEFGRVTTPDSTSSFTNFDNDGEIKTAQQTYTHGTDNRGLFGDVEFFSSNLECSQYNTVDQDLIFLHEYLPEQHLKLCSEIVDCIYDVTPISLDQNSEFIEPGKEKELSFRILKNLVSKFGQCNGENKNKPQHNTSGRKCSILEIVQLAGEKFIHFFSQEINDLSDLSHPFGSSSLGLTEEENRDVELVQDLLSSAEKVGQQEFERATSVLGYFNDAALVKGNPVERLVHYFSLALRQKISLQISKIPSKRPCGNQNELVVFDEELNMSIISFHQKVPFSSVIQFSGMQAILENVREAKKVHVVDLEIRSGMQYTVLMQALSARYECPVEYLKITVVGTKSRQTIQETGQRLMSFAESINLPFYFNVVMVTDMIDLSEDLIKVEKEEAVAFYFPYVLSSMIVQPVRIENLMKVVKNTNPRVVVLFEVEANHNSPVFVSRFVEALFYYAAFFDSLEDSMDCNDKNRLNIESKYIGPIIENIVSAEGGERVKRHVSVDVWRSFFSRFGLRDTELSVALLYQARLVVDKFDCGGSCTIDSNDNCLVVGWKGMPIFSLSTWKFS